jgi:hypothetical protein
MKSKGKGRREGKGGDGMGWDGMGWDGMGWDGMGWDGMGWDGRGGRGWDGKGREGIARRTCQVKKKEDRFEKKSLPTSLNELHTLEMSKFKNGIAW